MRKYAALILYATCSVCLKAQLPVPLGSAATFGVLAGSTVTSTGATVVNGNLGISPGSALTGFPPGMVIGGTINLANPVAAQAQADLTAAYNNAAGRPCPGPPMPGNIGGTTFLPGVYCNSTSVGITGTVTLNGNGNPNAVFIFQIGSTLTTAAGNSAVVLIGGAVASNVFWQVGSSATLGTNTTFSGTIMALASITATTGVALNGRTLARTGAVTLADNAISVPAPAGAPLSVTCAFPNGQVGVAYSSSLVASGGTPPYTYSISAGSLPPGLALNPSTGAITGIPTTAGSFAYTAKVVDSAGGSATSGCGPLIIAPRAVGLSVTCASSHGQVGVAYSSSLGATGGTPPYTFSISAGSLPPGLVLNPSTGVITGKPTTAGSFAYTAKVVDSTGASATSSCGPLIVAPVGLSVTCAFPKGQVDVNYSSSLVGTGGTAPYTFSISAGSLPPGLVLNPSTGVVTGKPTVAGSFSYTAKVTDSTGASATSSCGPFIIAPALISGVPAPPSLILVLTGLALFLVYMNRQRLLS
jgi:hypothetical protein